LRTYNDSPDSTRQSPALSPVSRHFRPGKFHELFRQGGEKSGSNSFSQRAENSRKVSFSQTKSPIKYVQSPVSLSAVEEDTLNNAMSPSSRRSNTGPVEMALAGSKSYNSFALPSESPIPEENGNNDAHNLEHFRALNRIIMKKSKRAELIVLNLPEIWSCEQKEAARYMEGCDLLTAGLDRVLLIHSSGHEIFDI